MVDLLSEACWQGTGVFPSCALSPVGSRLTRILALPVVEMQKKHVRGGLKPTRRPSGPLQHNNVGKIWKGMTLIPNYGGYDIPGTDYGVQSMFSGVGITTQNYCIWFISTSSSLSAPCRMPTILGSVSESGVDGDKYWCTHDHC